MSEWICLLDGENGLILAVSVPLLCGSGIDLGRSDTFGVCGASPPMCDKIDFRMSLLQELAGVAPVRFSNDDFWNRVFGVAGVSNNLNARTLRYGGDSRCILFCNKRVCRIGRAIELFSTVEKYKLTITNSNKSLVMSTR